MADELVMEGKTFKRRNVWGVWLLSLVTLGIYHFVWYFKINAELRDYPKRNADVNPWVSLLAVTFGVVLVVPLFVSIYNTGRRVLDAQEASGSANRANPWIGLGLSLIWSFHMPYLQTELNKVWDEELGPVPAGA